MSPKVLRGQLRQIVQEMLPQLIAQAQYDQIQKAVDKRIIAIEESVKNTLHEINERHKETMGYLVRQVTSVSTPKVEDVIEKNDN